MFGSIGMTELIVILVVALVVIGPKRLPELARSLGKALGDFKRATSDFQDSFNLESDYDLDLLEDDAKTEGEKKKAAAKEQAPGADSAEEEEREAAEPSAPEQAAPGSASPENAAHADAAEKSAQEDDTRT